MNAFLMLRVDLIDPKESADLNELSESDLACIDESLKENQDLSFTELKKKGTT